MLFTCMHCYIIFLEPQLTADINIIAYRPSQCAEDENYIAMTVFIQ